MAGTKTTTPPMPKRPTSTPPTSPSRRIAMVIVIKMLHGSSRDPCNPSPLFSIVLLATATSREYAVTLANAHVFLFAWNLLYLLVSVTSAVWPAGILLDHLGSQMTLDPRKYRSVDSGRMGVNNDEECYATHAYRPEAGIFQRRQ